MKREFTGRHAAAILVSFFSVVISVNLFMAYHATHDFGGVVVENSYVASQQYNRWLDEARREKALGWGVTASRDAQGRLEVATTGAPDGVTVTADMRRPLGSPNHRQERLTPTAQGRFVSSEVIPAGRWVVRVTVTTGSRTMRQEVEIA